MYESFLFSRKSKIILDLNSTKFKLPFILTFSLPTNFKYEQLVENFDIPDNLLELIKKEQKAFLALKIVEIIGEDEPYELDPETIYFVTNLLNKMNLVTIRNKVLNSALPLRT